VKTENVNIWMKNILKYGTQNENLDFVVKDIDIQSTGN
jgi:hypothetical protein